MLFVHEVHQVVGAKEDEFEALFRDSWMPTLAQGDDARLLWYMNHAHGSGAAYNVVTITGVRDGAAWQRLDERLRNGDLRDWVAAYEAGLAAWRAGDFTGAIGHFEQARKLKQPDAASSLMIERCKHQIENPTAEDWDGTTVARTK